MNNNEFEVVALAQEGNVDAINFLYTRYKPIIVKKSQNAILCMLHHGVEINDIMQEAYLGLDEAIKNFSQDDMASFYTFASLCIDRKIANYIKRMTVGKNKILNDAIYIDDDIEGIIKDKTNIESEIIDKDNFEIIISDFNKNLTNFEKKVLKYKLDGYNREEIAKLLNKDVKAIYNAFQRIKLKYKKMEKNDN